LPARHCRTNIDCCARILPFGRMLMRVRGIASHLLPEREA